MTNPLVIDLSHWQSKVDFAKLRAGGTIGVILKATQGTTYLDATYVAYKKEAVLVGLCTAPYHYLSPGDVAKQMQFFVNSVKPDPGSRLIVDYEANGLTIADLELAVKTLIDLAPDREITVYGANGFLGAQLAGKRNDLLANNTSLWVASYTDADQPTTNQLKGTWPVWSLWQYSQNGIVNGISGNCDVNRWNGKPETLPAWFHRGYVKPAPNPTPVSVPQDVVVEVHAPDGVPVKVLVNGKLIS